MQKQPKYRKTLRHPNWNYSDNGYYFITICIKNKKELFGEITDGEMKLNGMGNIVNKCWNEIPNHFPNIKLDEFIIMPNHIHGILIIENDNDKTVLNNGNYLVNRHNNQVVNRHNNQVVNRHACSLQRQYELLPIVIGSFKSACTKQINQKYSTDSFQSSWQKSFHDRIIRNEKELQNIRKYIQENPQKWELDEENPRNL